MNDILQKLLVSLACLCVASCASAQSSQSAQTGKKITDADVQAYEEGRITLDELFSGDTTTAPAEDDEYGLGPSEPAPLTRRDSIVGCYPRLAVGRDPQPDPSEICPPEPSDGTASEVIYRDVSETSIEPPRPAPIDSRQVITTPIAPPSSAKVEVSRYSSYEEMAADPRIQRLFKQWIGPGTAYVNRNGKWATDLTKTRRNSYAGLSQKGFTSCRIGKMGYSNYVRFGQRQDLGASGNRVVDSRGGGWPSSQDTTPEKQAEYESYCELFNQLAPHFIDKDLLEN